MSLQNGRSNSIRRYLLGELSEEEREQVEQSLMSDDDLYQELLFAENELIDDYLFDKLPEEDRPKFQQRFMHVPELRQSVSFAASLRKHALKTAPQVVAAQPAPEPSLFDKLKAFFLQPAAAATFATLLLGIIVFDVWFFKQYANLQNRVAQLEAGQNAPADLQRQLELAQARNEELSADLQRTKELLAQSGKGELPQSSPTPRAGTGVLVMALTSGVVRDSGQWTKFSITPDKKTVSFRLDVAANDSSTYQATLQTLDGDDKLTRKGLKARTNVVVFDVPAGTLTPGDYRIVLTGATSAGPTTEVSYYFRVLN